MCGGVAGGCIFDVFLNKRLLTPCCRSRETRLLWTAERLSCVSLGLISPFQLLLTSQELLRRSSSVKAAVTQQLGLLCPDVTERKYRKKNRK